LRGSGHPKKVPTQLTLDLPAAPLGIPKARAAVTQLCDSLDVAHELRENIRLAVTEACTNCVLHAYNGAAPTATYRLEAREEPGEIVVVVQDWGGGIGGGGDTPAALRQHGSYGRGFALMRAVATTVEIASAIGKGTRVELRFAVG
jgi:anti-sigma regulatory factor (Ser/Thr protein kinase)